MRGMKTQEPEKPTLRYIVPTPMRRYIRRNLFLQRVLAHTRAMRLARNHPEGIVPPVPKRIIVEPTNACNLRCLYCGNRDMVRKTQYLSLDVYERLLDQMVELGIPRITLHTIGESTLHPELPKIISMASQRGLVAVMSSNGTRFDEERAREVVRAGLYVLNVSTDSASQETLDKTREGARVSSILNGLRNLNHFRDTEGPIRDTPWGRVRLPTITVNCVVTPLFTREEERSFFETYGPYADDFYFQQMHNHAGYVSDETMRTRNWLPSRFKDAVYRAVREPCHYPWDALYLLADGTISVCRYDFDARVRIGRFPEQSLEELWNSDAIRSLRKAHLSFDYADWEMCRNCSATWYENRARHHHLTQSLKRRNGFRPRRDAWLPADPAALASSVTQEQAPTAT